jgi:hypothetical protein
MKDLSIPSNDSVMEKVIKFSVVAERIISLRGTKVLLDTDEAYLYGVETKRVNEAVKNNPEKFPEGYVIQTANRQYVESKHFTENGLYLLATILKSEQATQTTLSIVETFAKIRKLSRTARKTLQDKRGYHTKSIDAAR